MLAISIEPGMVLQDDDGSFFVVRNAGNNIRPVARLGWWMLLESLDLHEDLTFHASGYQFYETAYAAESFYSYVGRWPAYVNDDFAG